MVSCASNRIITGFSLPLAINCSKITLMGGRGVRVIGNPKDINRDPEVNRAIREMPEPQYFHLVRTLAIKQFPGTEMLSDAGT